MSRSKIKEIKANRYLRQPFVEQHIDMDEGQLAKLMQREGLYAPTTSMSDMLVSIQKYKKLINGALA